MNVVMTGAGHFVEVQGTAEGAAFTRAEMDALLALAEKGIARTGRAQQQALALDRLARCAWPVAPQAASDAMKLVLASNNAGKLAELQALFAPLGVELVPQAELGIVARPTSRIRTFVENALAKARHAARASGLPAHRRRLRACASMRSAACRAWRRRAIRRRSSATAEGRRRQQRARRCIEQLLRRLDGIADRARASSARWWRCAPPTTRSR